MARRRTVEQVVEEHIATASREELSSLIRSAKLVLAAKYPEAAPAAARRGRPVGATKKQKEATTAMASDMHAGASD